MYAKKVAAAAFIPQIPFVKISIKRPIEKERERRIMCGVFVGIDNINSG
jgi:hypothetical protein